MYHLGKVAWGKPYRGFESPSLRQTTKQFMNIYYTAYFIDSPRKLLEMFPTKHPVLYADHSTNKYKPNTLDGVEIGKKISLKIIGRVTDEKCDVLLVENSKSENKYPHITLSCTRDTPPVYTNYLLEKADNDNKIEYFSEPFYIEATEGYCIKKEERIIA